MRIHSDTLEGPDLFRALPDGVRMYCTPKGSRKRDHAFEVTLYVTDKDELHRRYGNSGGYGSCADVAATWDEWGLWIDALYALDPRALIGWYQGPAHFRQVTARDRELQRAYNKPGSLAVRTHQAPWLAEVAA